MKANRLGIGLVLALAIPIAVAGTRLGFDGRAQSVIRIVDEKSASSAHAAAGEVPSRQDLNAGIPQAPAGGATETQNGRCTLDPGNTDEKERASMKNDLEEGAYPIKYHPIAEGERRAIVADLAARYGERVSFAVDPYGFINSVMITDPGFVTGEARFSPDELARLEGLMRENWWLFGLDSPDNFSLSQCFATIYEDEYQTTISTHQAFSPDGNRRALVPVIIAKYKWNGGMITMTNHLWSRGTLPNEPAIKRREMLDRLLGTRVIYAGPAPASCPGCVVDANARQWVDADFTAQEQDIAIKASASNANEEGRFGNWLWRVPFKNEEEAMCRIAPLELRYWWNWAITVPVGDGAAPLVVRQAIDSVTGEHLTGVEAKFGDYLPVRCERRCGDEADGTTCVITCQAPQCGDARKEKGWEICDDGNQDDGDSCPWNCQPPPTCGDNWCERDIGETPENCYECKEIVCGCEEQRDPGDTNGYPWGMDAPHPDEVAARAQEFRDRYGDAASAEFDEWGFIKTATLRIGIDGGNGFSRADIDRAFGFIAENGGAFGIDDPYSLQWLLSNPAAQGLETGDLDRVESYTYTFLTTTQVLNAETGRAGPPVTVQKNGSSLIFGRHFWPGGWIPKDWRLRWCDVARQFDGRTVRVVGVLRKADDWNVPLSQVSESCFDADGNVRWDICEQVDRDFTIHPEDIMVSREPWPVDPLVRKDRDPKRVEIRYLYNVVITIRFRGLEWIRQTAKVDGITGEEVEPLPDVVEWNLPKNVVIDASGSSDPLAPQQESGEAPSEPSPQEEAPPAPADQPVVEEFVEEGF